MNLYFKLYYLWTNIGMENINFRYTNKKSQAIIIIEDETMEATGATMKTELENKEDQELMIVDSPEKKTENPDSGTQVMEGKQMKKGEATGNTEGKGVSEILREMETVLLGARETVGKVIPTARLPVKEEELMTSREIQVNGEFNIGRQATQGRDGSLEREGVIKSKTDTNDPLQEKVDNKEMEDKEEEELLQEDLELREKALTTALEGEKERNRRLEITVEELRENDKALRSYTKLCQRDMKIMEGRLERMEGKEKELEDQILELMERLEEARAIGKAKLVKEEKVEPTVAEARKNEPVTPEPRFRSMDIREKEMQNAGSSKGPTPSWEKERGRGNDGYGNGRGKEPMSSERKRGRLEVEQAVGGFGRTEVRGGVRITAELAAYYHKNWKIWQQESVEVDFKGVGPNRGWTFLADLGKEELKRVSFRIKDCTGLAVKGGMEVEAMVKRLEGVESEVKKLQFFYMEGRRKWLDGGKRKGWKDELAERETEMVVRGPFRPVLKAIMEIKEEWKHWKGTLGNERANRVRECYGKMTRDHLFWVCNPEQCWSRFI